MLKYQLMMNRNHLFCILFLLYYSSCSQKPTKTTNSIPGLIHENYELYQVPESEAVLVLFPGGGQRAEDIRLNFDILPKAKAAKITVLLMNFTNHLWLEDNDFELLKDQLAVVFDQHQLETKKIYFGGFSIGGNTASTLANYLHENQTITAPEGVFMGDSPIDLYALYQSAEIDLQNPNFSEERLAEPRWIVNNFKEAFGDTSLLSKIPEVSPFTLRRKTNSVPHLKTIKLRFYTEPDPKWWKENRGTAYEQTNAYSIQQLTKMLKAQGWDRLELIETQNQGYRSNGERHPHSWSIINIEALINWMKE